jgi:hypothetical protein
LPSGASTAAKQPALGTAGTASTDVITVQGITSMTPLLATLSGTNNIATVTTVSAVTAITNALPAGDAVIGRVKLTDGTDVADVLDLTNSNPLVVAMVDEDGTQVTPSLDATHDSAAEAVGPQAMAEAKDFDGAALPNSVTEGDAVRLAASQVGVQYVMVVNEDGSTVGSVAQSGTWNIGTVTTVTGVTTVSTVTTCSTVTTVGTLTSITNWGNIVDDAAFTPTTTRVSMSGFFADETATDSVDEGDGGAARMTLDRKIIVNPQPHTAGGCAIFRSLDLDETEEEVKGTAGQVYGMLLTNTSTGTRWLKFYNATAANVTVGSTTPVLTWGIPGNSSDDIGAAVFGAHGLAFDTAITVAVTTALADADTGAPGANDIIINIFYK